MARRERVYKPLTLKLSSIEDRKLRERILIMYQEFVEKRAAATKAARQAAIADAKAGRLMQDVRLAFIETIDVAGEGLPQINGEQTWTMYEKDGELLFECPFTEADQRNAMRAQRANMEHNARSLGAPIEDFYTEDAGNSDSGEREIGFAPARRPADVADTED